jgi:(2Fe-2S) ferredoxin
MCYAEPIMEVHLQVGQGIIYGNMTPDMAVEVLETHIFEGRAYTGYAVAQDARDANPCRIFLSLRIPLLWKTG